MTSPDIPGFRVERILGAGGMGVVYSAEEINLGRMVAVKTIRSDQAGDSASRERFLREARLMASIEDPNVVRVYSFGELENCRYLVMEQVEGESLADRLSGGRRLPTSEALRISLQVACALLAGAERGVIHRDVKPSNILIDQRDNVRVTDFGLSRSIVNQAPSELTQEGQFLGTPLYVAPEQATGAEAGIQADMYSLGVVLHEMLTGCPPFEGKSPIAIIARHLKDPSPRVRRVSPDVPASVQRLIDSLTRKDPTKRPESWKETVSAIRRELRSFAPPISVLDHLRLPISSGVALTSFVLAPFLTALMAVVVSFVAISTWFLMRLTLPRNRTDWFMRHADFSIGLLLSFAALVCVGGILAFTHLDRRARRRREE